MTQFIILTLADETTARVNVASIARYYDNVLETGTAAVETTAGGRFAVRHTVEALDDLVRNAGKDAVVSGS